MLSAAYNGVIVGADPEKGGGIMRRWRRRGHWGYVALAAGAIILAFIIMPSGFWWLMTGLALIVLGLYAISRC